MDGKYFPAHNSLYSSPVTSSPSATNTPPSSGLPLFKGRKLAYFKPGSDRPSIYSSEDMNQIVKAINALLSMRVKRRPASTNALSKQNVNSANLQVSDQEMILDFQDAIFDAEAFYPFKIYQVPQEFCPPADPDNDYDPVIDSWRTIQIRMGQISYRSAYSVELSPLDCGNWNSRFQVDGGSDGQINPTSSTLNLQNIGEVKYLPSIGIVSPSTPYTNVTWIINKIPNNQGSQVACAFWIEFTDSAEDGFYPVIKAQMMNFTSGRIPDRPDFPFPSGTNIFPIGIVYSPYNSSGSDLIPSLTGYNILTSNIVDRYSPPVITAQTGPMMFRGNWYDDDSGGLSGQVFYPGDVVTNIYDDGRILTFVYSDSFPAVVLFRPAPADFPTWSIISKYQP